MKNNSIRIFLTRLQNSQNKKHFFFEINLTRINVFLSEFLTREGFLRGYFFQNTKNSSKVKIFVIQKFDNLDLSCFRFIKRKNNFFDKIKSLKQKDLRKFCNGMGLSLFFSVHGFITNENLFWFRLGGKKIFELM